MTVRNARFADIPAIVGLLKRAYDKSHYAGMGIVNVDESEAKRLILTSIQRHGGKNGGATFIQIAERNSAVTGVIVGTLARVYSIGDKLMATDLFWLAEKEVDPADPARLMKNMIAWADGNKHVVEIRCGTTAVVADDPRRSGLILEHLGFQHYGEIYRKEI